MRKRGEIIVIWPAYLNANLTRKMGRRIPKEIAVQNPTIEELEEAVKELKINYIVEKDKKYPKTWFKEEGRILVEKKCKKGELIRKIALKINEKRIMKRRIEEEKRKRGKD
ncbi:MAG: signal recognition particle subunit SRP19/SEC65 family protein [Candidatus Methanomethylicia archaeon]